MAPGREAPGTYQLKITLMDIEPPIWRRIRVAKNTPLPTLHSLLQEVMGWTDSHLHQFEAAKKRYGQRDAGSDALDERKFTLDQVAFGKGKRFMYEYDFGDGWRHEVVVEEELAPDPALQQPRCLAGERACPPEDCGGVWGYGALLEAISDPTHPDHDDMLDWIDEDFDREAFDLKAVNRVLTSRYD